jgi:hypothetical protein
MDDRKQMMLTAINQALRTSSPLLLIACWSPFRRVAVTVSSLVFYLGLSPAELAQEYA